MTFHMSSLVLIRKYFLIKPSLFSILFSIFLLCLYIHRNTAIFNFITCVSFCIETVYVPTIDLHPPPPPHTHAHFLTFVDTLRKCVGKIFWPNVVSKFGVFYHKKLNAEFYQYPVVQKSNFYQRWRLLKKLYKVFTDD